MCNARATGSGAIHSTLRMTVTSWPNGNAMPLRSAITPITAKPGGVAVGYKALRQPLPRKLRKCLGSRSEVIFIAVQTKTNGALQPTVRIKPTQASKATVARHSIHFAAMQKG